MDIKTDNLKKEDIVYYDGEKWVNKSKKAYLHEQEREIADINAKYNDLLEQFNALKDGVNEKLKQFHDILQLQVNEGE